LNELQVILSFISNAARQILQRGHSISKHDTGQIKSETQRDVCKCCTILQTIFVDHATYGIDND